MKPGETHHPHPISTPPAKPCPTPPPPRAPTLCRGRPRPMDLRVLAERPEKKTVDPATKGKYGVCIYIYDKLR